MSLPNDILTVNPTFTIHDWSKAKPIIDACFEGTKNHKGNIYYGFIRNENGDKVECRECWRDAASLAEHIDGPTGIGGIMGTLVAPGIASLDAIYVTGPKEEVAAALKTFAAFGAVGYETMPGGFTNVKSWTGDELKPNTHVTVHPTFTIKNWAKAQPILDACVEGTRNHEGVIYYGMIRMGDKVKCRECWVDAGALANHISGPQGIGETLGSLFAPDIATFDGIFVAAPEDQLEPAKEIFKSMGVEGYEVISGFSKFTL